LQPVARRVHRLFGQLERERPARILPEQPVASGYFTLVLRMHRALDELHRGGVAIVDPRRGRLYFPARRAGRDVLLCWSLDAETVESWHERGSGTTAQRSVDDDGPWEPV
jgi:hypothetical protein